MATFKAIVRYKRADGFYQVYIRVVHRSKMGYIKTDKFITDKQLTKAGEIKDAVVNEFCSREILRYSDMINRHEVSNYSVSELIEFLQHSDGDEHTYLCCFEKMDRQSGKNKPSQRNVSYLCETDFQKSHYRVKR